MKMLLLASFQQNDHLDSAALRGSHNERGQVPGHQDREQQVDTHKQALAPARPAIDA
jgi:hypothetical protein